MFPYSLDLCLNEIVERIVKKKKEKKSNRSQLGEHKLQLQCFTQPELDTMGNSQNALFRTAALSFLIFPNH